MELAEMMATAVSRMNKSGLSDYEAEEQMIQAESAICDLLSIPLDETEMGLTDNAVAQIESFVSKAIGHSWSYASS